MVDLRAWRDFAERAPEELTIQVLFWGLPPLPDLPEEMHNAPVVVVAGMFAGTAEEGERALAPLRSWG